MTGADNPYAIEFLRHEFLHRAAEAPFRADKIYIPRGEAIRAPFNEAEVIDLLQHDGWTIIYPERFHLRDQIAIFAQARQVCAVHGAGLTNLLWCQPGTKVLELLSPNYMNGCYEGLASYLHLSYHFRLFPSDADGRLEVNLDQLMQAVRDLNG